MKFGSLRASAGRGWFLSLVVVMASASTSEAGFVLTAEAAGVQSTRVANTTTETFDGIVAGKYPSLTTAIGTISSPNVAIVPANSYGGAGGTGKYAAFGAQSGSSTALLTLTNAATYFGFWWSAADSQNQIDFLSGGKVVASFDPTTALNALGNDYFRNPNNGADGGEKFAYLNLFGINGSSFDQVRFSNLSQGTGFESDNWSVASTAFTRATSGTVIGGIPEPSSLLMVASGVVGVGALAVRRRRGR